MAAESEIKNKVRDIRLNAGLTQSVLAGRAKTSQQQVARIERGVQRASFDIAVRLSEALGEPLEKVFPSSRAAVKKMFKMDRMRVADDMLNGGNLTDDLAKADIDLDPRIWRIRMGFANGMIQDFNVTASEQRYMRDAMFKSEPSFLVFDSEDVRVLVNINHAQYAHWRFEPPSGVFVGPEDADGGKRGVADPDSQVIVYLKGDSSPLCFEIDEDQPEDPPEEGGTGQMGHIFYMAQFGGIEADYRFHFEDGEGEEVFLLSSAVSMMSVPLWVVEPALLEAKMEAFEEKETAEAGAQPTN